MVNSVVLVGRLTKDVEVRKTQTGLSVASFTVACDRRVSKDAQQQQAADFINCVAWRQSADFLGQYARKGAMVSVEGRIQTRSYDKPDGTKAFATEVVCDNVHLLESKAQSQARAAAQPVNAQYGGYQQAPVQQAYPQQGGYTPQGGYQQPAFPQQGGYGQPQAQPAQGGLDITNDDLPF